MVKFFCVAVVALCLAGTTANAQSCTACQIGGSTRVVAGGFAGRVFSGGFVAAPRQHGHRHAFTGGGCGVGAGRGCKAGFGGGRRFFGRRGR